MKLADAIEDHRMRHLLRASPEITRVTNCHGCGQRGRPSVWINQRLILCLDCMRWCLDQSRESGYSSPPKSDPPLDGEPPDE